MVLLVLLGVVIAFFFRVASSDLFLFVFCVCLGGYVVLVVWSCPWVLLLACVCLCVVVCVFLCCYIAVCAIAGFFPCFVCCCVMFLCVRVLVFPLVFPPPLFPAVCSCVYVNVSV